MKRLKARNHCSMTTVHISDICVQVKLPFSYKLNLLLGWIWTTVQPHFLPTNTDGNYLDLPNSTNQSGALPKTRAFACLKWTSTNLTYKTESACLLLGGPEALDHPVQKIDRITRWEWRRTKRTDLVNSFPIMERKKEMYRRGGRG